MKLLTQELRKALPPLYNGEDLGMDAIAHVHYFHPMSNWHWYASEFDGVDRFFGLVKGFENEMGYFSLKEFESCAISLGLPMERDLHWTPKPLKDC